jgi:hypothetical protein
MVIAANLLEILKQARDVLMLSVYLVYIYVLHAHTGAAPCFNLIKSHSKPTENIIAPQ